MIDIPVENATAFRLLRHYLAKPAPKKDLARIAGDIGGIQAQMYPAAQMSLGVRVKGAEAADIDKALWDDKKLAKLWTLRQTVHLVPSADLPMFVAAFESQVDNLKYWFKQHNLSPKQIASMLDKTMDALSDGPLTRKELVDRLEAGKGSLEEKWIRDGWGGIMKVAVMCGDALFGPQKGQEITYVRMDRWIPGFKKMPAAEAIAELIRRYLATYGPSTLTDFSYWSGIKASHAKDGFEIIRDEVEEVNFDGKPAFIFKKDSARFKNGLPVKPVVKLLPNFETYLLGYRDKSQLVSNEHYKKVYRKAGWISAVILINGRASGTWGCERKGKRVELKLEPFEKFPPEVKHKIDDEAKWMARFRWGCDDVELKIK